MSLLDYYEIDKEELQRIKEVTDKDDYSFQCASRILQDGYVIVKFYLDKDTGLLTHKFLDNKMGY